MQTLTQSLHRIAKLARITLLDVREPTAQQSATAQTASQAEAQKLAGVLGRTGLQVSALSRGHRHLVYIW